MISEKSLPQKVNNYNIFKSFKYAFFGLKSSFFREPNLIIQISIGLFFSILGIYTGHLITAMANFILMGVVMSLELLNTSIENLCDLVEPKFNLKVKAIKDISAASVLLVSLTWLVIIIYQILILFFYQNVEIILKI